MTNEQRVEKYQMVWNAGENQGVLILLLEGGETVHLTIDTADEGTFLLDLLRNESPVFYEPNGGVVCTGFEPVGEGEAAVAEAAS